MSSQICRVFILAVLVAAVACSSKKDAAGSAETEQEASGEQAASLSDNRLGPLVDVVVAAAAELPRAEFEPAALAKKLGNDPQAHFEWVRDNTWWAPYRGLLRGSQGVMLDRVGSNLDRAVLLGDLLRRSGHTVRLVQAQLPDGRARELLGKVRPIPDQRRSGVTRNAAPAERQRTIESLIPGHGKLMQEHAAISASRVEEAEALIRSQGGRLYAVVKDHVARESAGDKDAVAAMRDHWWVERQENGKWMPMDVLLPDTQTGAASERGSSTVEWKAGSAAPAIAESDWHSVGVRVVIERYENGATTESALLETVLRPAELLERPITLVHIPKPWPDQLADVKSDPNALGNAAVSVREWVPVLRVGEDTIVQSGFTESGTIIANPFDPKRDVAAAGGGGFMTGFGEQLGGDGGGSSSLTAEWIDYDIRVPGQPGQLIRRPVFDILGPANRAEKVAGFDTSTNDRLIARYEALLSSTDILLAPCAFTGEFVTHLATAGIVVNQDAIKALVKDTDPAKKRDHVATILDRLQGWGPLPDLMLWRSQLSDLPGDWFIDRPNVLSYRMTRSAVNADRVAFRELIDVASNSISVRLGSGRSPVEVRVHQGVADTVAEMMALGADLKGIENTAALLASSGQDAGGVKRISPRDSEAAQGLGWSGDTGARLAMDVDAGLMAVVPATPVAAGDRQRVGWWRVDPASGETIGVMDTGYNQGLTDEEVVKLKVALQNFLKKDAEAWARIRARSRLPVPIGESVARDLAIRDVAMELLRDLIRLGY